MGKGRKQGHGLGGYCLQARDDGGLDLGCSCGGGGRWLDSAHILKIEITGFALGLD